MEPGARHRGERLFALKELWERTSSLPGARAVGIAQEVPPDGRRLNVTIDGAVNLPQEKMYVDRLMIGPGFFEAMGIPILTGRAITARDDEYAPNVCVVSGTMARAFFGDRSPIGHHYHSGVDVHLNDQVGGWLSDEELRERERRVFDAAIEHHLPLVWCMGGGYQRDSNGTALLDRVVALHTLSIQAFRDATN